MKNLFLPCLFFFFQLLSAIAQVAVSSSALSTSSPEDEKTPKTETKKPDNHNAAASTRQSKPTITQTAQRQLKERGFSVCSTDPKLGDIYASADRTRFCYIDPKEGIMPATAEQAVNCVSKPAVVSAPPPSAPSPNPAVNVNSELRSSVMGNIRYDQIVTTPAETGFRVLEALVHVNPQNFSGDCPHQIVFTARISAVGGAGTVSYRWLRNDGASAPVETLKFDGPGTKTVETTWYLGGSGQHYKDFWEQLEIFDPKSLLSNKAFFTLECK